MPPMSKVDLFAAIRRDYRAGLSVRALARKYQVSRRTVRSALTSAWPAPRKPMPPRPSKLDAFKPVIDDILRADLDAPRKQRHTVKRIYDRLIDERDMRDVSYQVVRAYVADRSPRSAFRPGGARPTCSSRRPTGPARKRRSTSVRSRSTCAVNW
jgi:transposase